MQKIHCDWEFIDWDKYVDKFCLGKCEPIPSCDLIYDCNTEDSTIYFIEQKHVIFFICENNYLEKIEKKLLNSVRLYQDLANIQREKKLCVVYSCKIEEEEWDEEKKSKFNKLRKLGNSYIKGLIQRDFLSRYSEVRQENNFYRIGKHNFKIAILECDQVYEIISEEI